MMYNNNRRARRPGSEAANRERSSVPTTSRETVPPKEGPPIRLEALGWLARAFLVSSVLATFGLLLSAVTMSRRPPEVSAAVSGAPSRTNVPTKTPAPTSTIAYTPTPTLTPAPTFTPTPDIPRIGILAGHSGGADPGAICADGLREVDVTTDVATRAQSALVARGYVVDILQEFDPRITNGKRDYSPKAFLAIHADSCVWYASGYKVARASSSASPDEDDRLVRCVTNAYGLSSQLPFHAGSITVDMTDYHAFNQINPRSPGAIIELGFMGSDHELLKSRRDILAQGVANGLDDFMRGNQCK